MKVSLLALILFLLFYNNSFGQDKNVDKEYNKNTIFATVSSFGILGGANLNYERAILRTDRVFLSTLWIRIGGGYWYEWADNGPQLYISAVGLLGQNNSHLEYGIGITSLYNPDNYSIELSNHNAGYGDGVMPTKWDNTDIKPRITIGYRYQKPKGHFILRTGLVTAPAAMYLSLGLVF